MENKLEGEIQIYQDFQKELTSLVNARSLLDSQVQENQMVQQEFKILSPASQIYKQIVLIKQDRIEATTNVDKRIEFITKELKRLDALIKEVQTKAEKTKVGIVELQTALQQQTVTA